MDKVEMSKIKVGKLSKSISEELGNSSDVHDFKLVITCADNNSSTQLEGLIKKYECIVYGYFGKMIISLDNGLHLVVQVDSSDESLTSVFSAILNKGNYKRVFDNVDDLITEFKEKSPDSDTYLELLKESI